MNFNLAKKKEGVELTFGDHAVCVFANSNLVGENMIISDRVSILAKEELEKITFDL
jgi:hypothetical protein